MQAFLAALVGGFRTIAGGLAAVLVTGRSTRNQWRNDTQLKVGTEVLSALQGRVSSISDLAYLADKHGYDGEKPWLVKCAADMEWNNARRAALLVSPPEIAALPQALDGQSDSLLVQAMARQWTQRNSGRSATVLVD